jgi:hypothetical protein
VSPHRCLRTRSETGLYRKTKDSASLCFLAIEASPTPVLMPLGRNRAPRNRRTAPPRPSSLFLPRPCALENLPLGPAQRSSVTSDNESTQMQAFALQGAASAAQGAPVKVWICIVGRRNASKEAGQKAEKPSLVRPCYSPRQTDGRGQHRAALGPLCGRRPTQVQPKGQNGTPRAHQSGSPALQTAHQAA